MTTKSKEKMNMKWESDQKETDKEPEKEVTKPNKKINEGLGVNEMKKLLADHRSKHPEDSLEPVVVKTTRVSANRFYIIKSIPLSENDRIDELFIVLLEEERKKLIGKAEKEWKKNNKVESDDEIPENQRENADLFVEDYLTKNIARIRAIVNHVVLNVVGVVWPESHSSLVVDGKVPGGDVPSLGMAIQVLSGYSEIDMDLDVYQKNEIELPEQMRQKEEDELKQLYDEIP